jgi:hypothetical protein
VYLQVDIAANPPAVELRDRDNLGKLSIRVRGEPTMDQLRIALAEYARLDDVNHAYIQIAALCTLAGDSARNEDWRDAFDGMIDCARAHGWVDQDGAVRAHIETGV